METRDEADANPEDAAAAAADSKTLASPRGGGGEDFVAGDLVWGKLRGQPWWPARVAGTFPGGGSHHHRRKSAAAGGPDVLVDFFGRKEETAKLRPSQLRPFLGANGPDEMACESTAKGFVKAVEVALKFISSALEDQLTCHCVPLEPRPTIYEGGGAARLGVTNFSPEEFLDCLRGVAVDVSGAGLVECVRMKSWASAFGKNWDNGLPGYFPRRSMEELVDKIDLDVPASELLGDKEDCDEGEEEEVDWIAEHGSQKGLNVPEEKQYRSRKRRSMAALMEEMDGDAVDSVRSEEAKVEKNENKKANDRKGVEVGSQGGKTGEEFGSIKRERKKSKYLSPPYTNPSGNMASSGLPNLAKRLDDGSLGLSSDLLTLEKSEGETVQKIPAAILDGVSAEELFAVLCCTAEDVLHLKWNRSAKVLKAFIWMYKSSMFVEGMEYGSYQKHNCEAKVFKKAATYLSDDHKAEAQTPMRSTSGRKTKSGHKRRKTDEARKEGADQFAAEESAMKKKKRNGNVNGRTPLDPPLGPLGAIPILQVKAEELRSQGKNGGSGAGKRKGYQKKGSAVVSEQAKTGQERNQASDGSGMADHSERKNGSGRKKAKKVEAITGDPVNIVSKIVDVPIRTEHEDGQINNSANGEAVASSGKGTDDSLEAASLEVLKNAELINGDNVTATSGAAVPDPNGNVSNTPHVVDSAQKKKKKKKKAAEHFSNPAALLLDFHAGVVLPTKEELIAAFSKYGRLIESQTDIIKDPKGARVVFGKSAEAEAAYNRADLLGIFGPPFATLRLHYLSPIKVSAPLSPKPAQKPPLTDIRKNLEKMITSLTNTSPLKKAGSSDGPKTGTKENLVGEMQGLLAKVEKVLHGPSTSTLP